MSIWEAKGDKGDKAEIEGGSKLALVDHRSARYTCSWSPSGLLLIAPWWGYSYICRGHLLQVVTAVKYRQIPITAPQIPPNSEQIRAHLVTGHWVRVHISTSPLQLKCSRHFDDISTTSWLLGRGWVQCASSVAVLPEILREVTHLSIQQDPGNFHLIDLPCLDCS